MEKIIRQFGEIREANTDERTRRFVFSSGSPDRHRTVINQDRWKLDNFNKNGIIGYMHEVYGDDLLKKADPDDVLGHAKAWVEGGHLMGDLTFEPKDINEKADKVLKKIDFGTLNAVSVGFLETSEGHRGIEEDDEDPKLYYFGDVELIEVSVVNIPSQVDALQARNFKALNHFLEEQTDLTQQVTKSIKMEEEVKSDLPETSKVEVSIPGLKEISENLLATAEALKKAAEPKEEVVLPGPTPPEKSKEEVKIEKTYRLGHAILKFAERGKGGPWDGLEREMHEEGILQNKRSGVGLDSYEGMLVPTSLSPKTKTEAEVRATLQATVTAAGGAAVATDLLGFIETLRNEMIIVRAGAKILDGLEGNVSIPKRTADSTAYWVSEGGLVTQADPTYGSVTLAPHRLSAYTRFSRQFLRQSSFSVEAEVRDVLNYSMRQELEQTAFDGSNSSNQPDGIFNNSSVNNADHGSNGTLVNWGNIVTMESMLGADNSLRGNLSYITNSTMAGYLKTQVKNTYQGGFLWEVLTPLANGEGVVNGYRAFITNVLSNAMTKGTGTGMSPIILGNWSELLMGMWGAQEFIIDPYSRLTYDEINVVTVGYFDYALRHPESFVTIEAGRTS